MTLDDLRIDDIEIDWEPADPCSAVLVATSGKQMFVAVIFQRPTEITPSEVRNWYRNPPRDLDWRPVNDPSADMLKRVERSVAAARTR